MQARELTLDLPELRLAARAWGDPALPRLLALHGWLDNAASFDRLAPLLCDRFHIVALDLPGHGRSDHRPAGTWYHFVDALSDVTAAVDALEWRTFGLLGHSMGGGIASLLAAASPPRIERLLLIDALGPLTAAPEQTLAQLQRGLEQRRRQETKALRVFSSEAGAVAARLQANGLTRASAEILVARGLKPVAGGFSWSSDPRLTLASPQRFTEPQVLAMLAAIVAPTLLIFAEPLAPFLPEPIMTQRIAQLRDIRVLRIRGSHHLHLDDAPPVAAAIRAFVDA